MVQISVVGEILCDGTIHDFVVCDKTGIRIPINKSEITEYGRTCNYGYHNYDGYNFLTQLQLQSAQPLLCYVI